MPIAPWIQTLDGQKFDLLDPDPATIHPTTLATVLGRICRFGGHCLVFYSVAQHSLLVEGLVEDPELKLPALLHDAHEAYWGLGDVCSPAKHMNTVLYDLLHSHASVIDDAIAKRFDFNPKLLYDPAIKYADMVLLATEQRDVMARPVFPWTHVLYDALPERILPVSPAEASQVFLERLTELLGANDG